MICNVIGPLEFKMDSDYWVTNYYNSSDLEYCI